jgi:predicted ATPase
MDDQPTRQLLTKVTIDGLKSIKHAEIPLGPMNLIVGANGSGKSNFLYLLRLMKAGLIRKNEPSHVMTIEKYIKSGLDRLMYGGLKVTHEGRIGLSFADMPGDQIDAWLRFVPESHSEIDVVCLLNEEFGQKIELDHTSEQLTLFKGFPRNVKYTDRKKIFEAVLDRYIEEVNFYHFHDTSIKCKLRSPSKLNDNYFLKEDGTNIASFIYNLKLNHTHEYELITSTIKRVAPFFNGFSFSVESLDNYVRMSWTHTTLKGTFFDADDLSDGTLRFIALATVLLQPDKTLPKLIMIDEPELGLHPHALHLLAGMMQSCSARTQLIVATQSVTLVNQFTYKDLIIADFDDDQGCTTFRRPSEEDAKYWAEDYGLGELWERNWIGGTP